MKLAIPCPSSVSSVHLLPSHPCRCRCPTGCTLAGRWQCTTTCSSTTRASVGGASCHHSFGEGEREGPLRTHCNSSPTSPAPSLHCVTEGCGLNNQPAHPLLAQVPAEHKALHWPHQHGRRDGVHHVQPGQGARLLGLALAAGHAPHLYPGRFCVCVFVCLCVCVYVRVHVCACVCAGVPQQCMEPPARAAACQSGRACRGRRSAAPPFTAPPPPATMHAVPCHECNAPLPARQVASGSFVLDPYVGTGSIALAAAHHGAQVMGADIDARVVRLVGAHAGPRPSRGPAAGSTAAAMTAREIYLRWLGVGRAGRLMGNGARPCPWHPSMVTRPQAPAKQPPSPTRPRLHTVQGKVGPQGEHLDVYANFSHYGTQGRLAGLLRLDMHVHPFRGGLEEVRAGHAWPA